MSAAYEAHEGGEPAGTRVVERPPEGLARGQVPVPAWVVISLSGAIVMAGLAYLVWRFFPGVRR